MKNFQMLFALFLVFGLFGSIRGIDPVTSGDMYYMHINLKNAGSNDIEDLSIRVYIYDLGVMFQTSQFDLEGNDKNGKFVFWDVPKGIVPGEYWARITVSNDDIRRVKHRPITII